MTMKTSQILRELPEYDRDVKWPNTIGKNGPTDLFNTGVLQTSTWWKVQDLQSAMKRGTPAHTQHGARAAPAQHTASTLRACLSVRKPGCVAHGSPISSKLRHGWWWRGPLSVYHSERKNAANYLNTGCSLISSFVRSSLSWEKCEKRKCVLESKKYGTWIVAFSLETMEHSGASSTNQDYWIWSRDCAQFLWWQQEGFLGFMAQVDKTS